jgi:hypothetical protein
MDVSLDDSAARHPTPRLTSADDPALKLAGLSPLLVSRLSPRDHAIVITVERLKQLSTAQVQRLFFADGSVVSQGARTRRALARLHRWGVLGRIDRAVGGHNGGSDGYVYTSPQSRSRMPNMHTLDISEIYTRLVEMHRQGVVTVLSFDPEPYCHVFLGNFQYKPDGRIHLRTPSGEFLWFLELDRGSEWRTQLGDKMRRAHSAYNRWPEKTFPRVLWVVQDSQRADYIKSITRAQGIDLFDVCLFSQAVSLIAQ